MRIGFDAKKIVTNLTGIGNYSRGTIHALAEHYPDNQYILFAPNKGNERCISRLQPHTCITFAYPQCTWSLAQEWWRCHGITKDIVRNRTDIFHGLSNELPFGIRRTGCKSVVTIHDLIFLRYPQTYDPITRRILKAKTLYACRNADKIIAISQCTKQDIIKFYSIPEERIEVVYQGCNPLFYRTTSIDEIQAIKKRYGLPSNYLLCVGTLEQRKNQLSILQSLALANNDIHLVLTSKPTKYQVIIEERIKSLGLQQRVHILNNVLNPDLPAIYQGATAFTYLSWFEGFGIPVLEALVSGIPVIAATGSCLEEAGGPASLYCNPFDYQQIAAYINELTCDSKKREDMAVSGKEYAKRFSYQLIAQQLHSIYQQLMK